MTTAEKIKRKGLELGFTHVGIAAADDFTDYAEELESRPDYELWTDKDRSKYPNRSYLSAAAYPKGTIQRESPSSAPPGDTVSGFTPRS